MTILADTVPNLTVNNHHRFFTNKPMLVCGNTASMLSGTRYGKAFKVMGDRTEIKPVKDCSALEKLSLLLRDRTNDEVEMIYSVVKQILEFDDSRTVNNTP